MNRLFPFLGRSGSLSWYNLILTVFLGISFVLPHILHAQCPAPIIDSVFVNDKTIGRSGIAQGGPGTNMIVYGKNLAGGSVFINGISQTQILTAQSNNTRLVFIVGSAQNGNLCVSTPCGQSNCVGFELIRTCVRPEIYSVSPSIIPCGGNGATRLYIVGAELDNDVQFLLNGARLNRIALIQSQDFTVFPPVRRDTAIVEINNVMCIGNALIRAQNVRPECDTITSFPNRSGAVQFVPASQPAPTITNFSPQEGGPLTEIRVMGENLTNILSVRIGRAPAEILSTSPLIIQPGAGSRTGRIEIQTPGGTAVSQTDFVFIAPPVITSVTPTIIGTKTPVYIRGQNLLRATVNFGGVIPLSVQNQTDTLIIATIGTSGTITSVYPQLPASSVPVNVAGRGGTTVAPQRIVFVEAEYRKPMVSLRPTNPRGGARVDAIRQSLLLTERRATFLPPETQQTGDIAIIRQNWNIDVNARIRLTYRDSADREIRILRGFEITNAQREPIAFPIPPVDVRSLPFFPPRETETMNSQINGLWGDLFPRTATDTLRFGETFIPVRGVQSIFEFNRLDTSRISVRARWSDLIYPANPERINPADFANIGLGRQGRRTMTIELLSSETDEYDVDPLNNVVRVVLDDPLIEAPMVVNPVAEQQLAVGSMGQVFIEAEATPGSVALKATPNGGVIPADIFYDNNYFPLTYTVRSDNPSVLTVTQGNGSATFGSKPLVRFVLTQTAISGSTAAVIITANNGRGGVATHQFIVRAQQGAPVITGVNPSAGRVGSVLTITGRDFGTNPRVSFTGENGTTISATPSASSDTQITVSVPAGAETGRISITNSIATGNSPNEFVIVRTPQITSIAPDAAPQNTEITIRGTGFRGASQVFFGDVEAASFRVVSDTEIRAIVSARGASGTILVRNPLDSGRSVQRFLFYPAPSIQNYTPTIAGAGATLVVTGLNFSGAGFSAPSQVQIGGRNASFSLVSASQINVTVPDLGMDEMRDLTLQITTNGGTTTASVRFTFVPCPSMDAFSPASGSYGTMMTITGSGLQAVTGVNVGGVPVLSWALVSTTRITALLGSVESGAVELIAGRCTVSTPTARFTYQTPSRPLRFVLPAFSRTFPNERRDDSVTIINQSASTIVGNLTITQNEANFALGSPTTFTLQRNQSARLPLAFAPRSGGRKTATIGASLQGSSGSIDTAITAQAAIWQVIPADFDTVRTGRSTLRAVYVINRDNAPAQVESVNLPSDGAFRIVGQPLRWIGRGDTSALIVRCQPTVSQQRLQSNFTLSGSGDDVSTTITAFARAPLTSDIALEARITPDRDNVVPGQNIVLRLEITNAQNLDRLRGGALNWQGSLRWTHGVLLSALNRSASQPTAQGQWTLVRNSDPRNAVQRIQFPQQSLSSSFSTPFLMAAIPAGVYYSRDSVAALELEQLSFTHPSIGQRIFVEEPQGGSFGSFTAQTGGRIIQRANSAAVTVISPNPAQNMVSVKFSVPKETAVMLSLTDARGVLIQTLAEGWYIRGDHSIDFDASAIPSGSYMIMLHTEQDRISRPLQLVR